MRNPRVFRTAEIHVQQILKIKVYPLWWPSLTKDMQTQQLLCWSGMTDTEQLVHQAQTKKMINVGKVLRKRLKSQFSYRQHRVFIARSKL